MRKSKLIRELAVFFVVIVVFLFLFSVYLMCLCVCTCRVEYMPLQACDGTGQLRDPLVLQHVNSGIQSGLATSIFNRQGISLPFHAYLWIYFCFCLCLVWWYQELNPGPTPLAIVLIYFEVDFLNYFLRSNPSPPSLPSSHPPSPGQSALQRG